MALALVLLVGAALRVAYLAELRRDPFFLAPALDAELHDYWARGLAFDSWKPPAGRPDPLIRTTPYFRPPGYPHALALVYRLTGGSPVASRAVQLALGCVAAILGFLLARRYAGDAAGVVCAVLMATSWNLIFFEGELLDSFLLTLLAPAAILLVRAAADREVAWRALVAGVGLGVFALVRPNGLALLPAAAGWLLWVRRRSGSPSRWRGPTALLLGGAIAVLPAAWRNHRVSGEWILISANGGVNLYIGNNPEADGVRAGIPGVEALAGIRGWTCFEYPLVVDGLSRDVGRPLRYGEASRVFASRAWDWILDHPGRFLALTGKRLALLLGPSEVGDRDLDLTRAASPLLRALPGRFPWYLAGAAVGAALAFGASRRREGTGPGGEVARDRVETGVLLALFAGVYLATFLPFFFNARYRTPFLVVLFVFAADGAVRIARGVRERRWRIVLPSAGAFLGIGLLASVDLSGYRADAGEWHYQRGNAYRDARRLPEAIREYEAAIAASPRAVDPRRDLALVLRGLGRPEEAARRLREALAIDPRDSESRFDLGQLLAADGRFEAAARELERVLLDAPHHANAHLSLGTTLLQLDREPEAMAHYAEAERLAPRDPLVAFVVGRALVARGRVPEGLERLRRAVEIDPDFDAARRALAAAGG